MGCCSSNAEGTEHIVTASRVMAGKLVDVWPIVADLRKLEETSTTTIKKVEIVSKQKDQVTGLGAARKCYFLDDTSVIETVTGYEEHKRVYFTLSEFTFPMKSMCAEFTFTEDGDNTIVKEELFFVPDMCCDCVGNIMANLVIKGKLTDVIDGVLAGVQNYVKTGEATPADFEKPPK